MWRPTTIAILSAILASPAVAADLPLKAAPAPIMAAPVYNWTGIYVGAHIGGAWGRGDFTSFNAAGVQQSTGNRDFNGIFGGGQIGVNWQFAPNWLIGVEGDISAAGLRGSDTGCTVTGCATADQRNDWFGTLRGRLGFVSGNWLFYGTGGAAWMDNSVARTINCVGAGCPAVSTASPLVGQVATNSSILGGWVAGGGIEWAFARNWTAKVEYQHMEFTSGYDYNYSLATAFRHVDTSYHVDTVRLGINYLFNWGGGPVVASY